MENKRMAILSDIHANYPALEAVAEDLRRQDVNAIWFLGDLLDRGPFPVQCYSRLRNLFSDYPDHEWLLGNHEMAVMGQAEYQSGMADWMKEIENHHQRLMGSRLESFESMKPYAFRSFEMNSRPIQLFLSHGFPLPPEDFLKAYIEEYAPDGKNDLLAIRRQWAEHETEEYRKIAAANIWICGHSHAFTFWQYGSEAWKMGIEDFGISLQGNVFWEKKIENSQFPGLAVSFQIDIDDLKEDSLIILNPGSVGFPRVSSLKTSSGKARADYMIINIEEEKMTIDFRSILYETHLIAEKMNESYYPVKARSQMVYPI